MKKDLRFSSFNQYIGWLFSKTLYIRPRADHFESPPELGGARQQTPPQYSLATRCHVPLRLALMSQISDGKTSITRLTIIMMVV
jgi:hypothetical protein